MTRRGLTAGSGPAGKPLLPGISYSSVLKRPRGPNCDDKGSAPAGFPSIPTRKSASLPGSKYLISARTKNQSCWWTGIVRAKTAASRAFAACAPLRVKATRTRAS